MNPLKEKAKNLDSLLMRPSISLFRFSRKVKKRARFAHAKQTRKVNLSPFIIL